MCRLNWETAFHRAKNSGSELAVATRDRKFGRWLLTFACLEP